MAPHVESIATFKARIVEMQLSDLWPRLEEMRLTSYAQLASGTSYQPGQVDEKPLIDDIIKALVGADTTKYSSLRRLFLESWTLVSADLKRMLEPVDEQAPKKMSRAERKSRRDRVVPAVFGLDPHGRLDVADSTVDFVAAKVDNDAIVYLPWQKFPTRAQERRGTKIDKRWLVDHDSTVK